MSELPTTANEELQTTDHTCLDYKPYFVTPNRCVKCGAAIWHHSRETVQCRRHITEAIAFQQKSENKASLILDGSKDMGAVYLSGFLPSINDQFLKDANVKNILNVAGKSLSKSLRKGYKIIAECIRKDLDIYYLESDWNDSLKFDLTYDSLEVAVKFIHSGRVQGAVLVHCMQGISRSSSAVCAYIMATEGFGMQAAMLKIKSRREIACPNPNFGLTLKKFEKSESLKNLRKCLAGDVKSK